MKFRQHIRVYGYPDALKEKIHQTKNGVFDIKDVGVITLWGEIISDKFNKFLIEHKAEFKRSKRPDSVRVRYLLGKNGWSKAIRGKMYRGDILYTIEANDERELLDKRDAVIEELKTLKVPYEDVCKWVCETAPKVSTKRMFKPKQPKDNLNKTLEEIAQEQKKLKNTVDDLKDKLSDSERERIKRSLHQDRKAREGVLQ